MRPLPLPDHTEEMTAAPVTAMRRLSAFNLGPGGGRALALICAWKVATLLLVGFSAYMIQPAAAWPATYRDAPSLDWQQVRTAFSTWDSDHYIFLAEHGYQPPDDPKSINNAFYPLYPWSMRMLNIVAGDSVISGLVIANLASLAALYLFFVFVRERFDPDVAGKALILFIAFPTAFYLNIVYSEGLFLLLILIFVFCLYKEQFWGSAIALFLLPLARIIGVLAMIPTAVFLVTRGTLPQQLPLRVKAAGATLLDNVHYFLPPVLGLAVLFGFLYLSTGNPGATVDAQHWFPAQNSLGNLLRPDKFVANVVAAPIYLHDYVNSALDRAFYFAFLAILPLVYRRLDLTMFTICLVFGCTPFLGSFMATTRYLMVVFPVYIALALWFRPKGDTALMALAAPMLLLQSLFLVLHTTSHWVA